MAAISTILSIYLKSVFIFFILNGVATACCMRRIAENGWFEIDDLREGLTIFEILAVSSQCYSYYSYILFYWDYRYV